MLDTPLMLWQLGMTEQSYRAVLEVLAEVPVTLDIRLSITSRWLASISYGRTQLCNRRVSA